MIGYFVLWDSSTLNYIYKQYNVVRRELFYGYPFSYAACERDMNAI